MPVNELVSNMPPCPVICQFCLHENVCECVSMDLFVHVFLMCFFTEGQTGALGYLVLLPAYANELVHLEKNPEK